VINGVIGIVWVTVWLTWFRNDPKDHPQVNAAEMTISPNWSFCMDIGGESSGAASGAMNVLGNLGSAFSTIVFPYFVANITLPG